MLPFVFSMASMLACGGGSADSGSADSGSADSGTVDGGTVDGGTVDGGTDGGTEQGFGAVRINELMASNDSVVEDEAGEEDDWVELVNADVVDIDLAGWALFDQADADSDEGGRLDLPAGTVLAPGDHLLVWLDDDPEQGPLHANFKLDADGDGLSLLSPDGQAVDTWSFDSMETDVVLGRFPDATGAPQRSIQASPGSPNPDSPGADSDPSSLLFPQDDILDLDLYIDEDGLAALDADPFEYVQGGIGFDGVRLDGIGIRLKGHASLRDLDGKAAFRVSMDAFGGHARLRGLENLTLNNMVQDPSLVHEHLSYMLFRQLGVPAPRTAYLRLSLNGEARGLYLNVETPDDHFLARWYANAEGNLYEGAGGQDLSLADYLDLDQDQSGDDDSDDRSELRALAELLAEAPDPSRVDELKALVDTDEIERMWAGEILLGQWDGYFYSANNYRVYHDPSTGLLSMLPWGPDLTFEQTRSIFRGKSALPYWMLELPTQAAEHATVLGDAASTLIDLDLGAEATATHARVIDAFDADPYREQTVEDSDAALLATLEYLDSWPALVRWGVENDVDVGVE
ncbi:MAG: hypothetical protein GXP62_04485 [Oligoflexia bacterium]|nr:hypothetical protein [Oligoflexia bacterium]